ncbi:MAG: hypothetical protein NUV80_02440 [Candidatus Berkelbacteria bacterium]|nr:hypothetical protein [Candidatus Berkelbacteria bacterium]
METYVVIRDMSAGNDSVGEMWQETKVFNGSATIDEVMEWANSGIVEYSRRNITITKPHP